VKLRKQNGIAAAFLAVIFVIAMGFMGYSIDMAQTYSLASKVKTAIDLASLASISQLDGTSSIPTVKNTAVSYLNSNLSMTIPGFTNLTTASSDLSLQVGIYDSSTMTFTWDELSSSVNAIRISYTHTYTPLVLSYFMISAVPVTGTSGASKQIAGYMAPGTGFPLTIDTSTLATALASSNMIDLYASGSMDNSYWTDYTGSNPSTTDIRNVLDYFQEGSGTIPPGVGINDTFRVNDGGMGGAFNDLDSSVLVGMTYVFPVVTLTSSTTGRADGFIAATITGIVNSMGSKYISITIDPNYVDNTFGGLQVGTNATNVSSGNQSLLANAYGLAF
jgi:hypothetical protein